MTTPPVTDQQLLNYSGEHLMHELSMLWELADMLPNRKPDTETSAFVESFGIHLRNLIDFFYRKGQGDDVTASDFMDATTTWNPTKPWCRRGGRQSLRVLRAEFRVPTTSDREAFE